MPRKRRKHPPVIDSRNQPAAPTQTIQPGYLYADGHVHIYAEYDQKRFFERGLCCARSIGAPLLLLLTESEGHAYFRLLRDHVDARAPSVAPASSVRVDVAALEGLAPVTTGEPFSLAVAGQDSAGPPVILVAGRQFISKENLEVLIVGLEPEDALCSTPAGDRRAEELIERGLEARAIVILPWGFGKWIGSRGRLVTQLASRDGFGRAPLFFLGDTSARCWPWHTPKAFCGPARVLPGTDMLPLPGFEDRLARYGFRLRGNLDRDTPFGSLVNLLRRDAPLEPFGRRDSPFRAMLTQFRLRLHRRNAAPSATR